MASFAISIGLLVWWGLANAKQSKVHPAQTWLLVSIIYIAAMVFHPFTSSTLAGIAQLVLYVSVMAPVFWAPAVVRGPDHLARLMTAAARVQRDQRVCRGDAGMTPAAGCRRRCRARHRV